MVDEIRLTPPRRARRLMAGFVIPVRTSLAFYLVLDFPKPFPLPFPDILLNEERWGGANYSMTETAEHWKEYFAIGKCSGNAMCSHSKTKRQQAKSKMKCSPILSEYTHSALFTEVVVRLYASFNMIYYIYARYDNRFSLRSM